MNKNEVSIRTKELINEYGQLLGLPDGWEKNISINDFLTIRNAAIHDISSNIYQPKETIKDVPIQKQAMETTIENKLSESYVQNNKEQKEQVELIKDNRDIEQEATKKDSILENSIQAIEDTIDNHEDFDDIEEKVSEKTKEEKEIELFSQFPD